MAILRPTMALVLALASVAAGAAGAAGAPRYELVDLGGLHRDDTSSAAAINNADQVVGYAGRPNGASMPVRFVDSRAQRVVARDDPPYRSGDAVAISDAGHVTGTLFLGPQDGSPAFVSYGGITTLYGPQEGGTVLTQGVNSNGLVVGWRSQPRQAYRAFTMQDGQWLDLPVPQPELPSFAYAVNDAGQVAGHLGQQVNGVEMRLGALWQDGELKETFGLPGSPYTLALAINRQGWVTGYSQVGRYLHQTHAFIHRDGVTIDLEQRQKARSHASAINASGEVIGERAVAGVGGSFLYSGGRMWWLAKLLPKPQQAQWRLVLVHGINDAGHIVGVAQNLQGNLRAVMLRRLPARVSAG